MDKWEETRVWWDDNYKSWVVTSFDSEGNTVSTEGYNDHYEFYGYKSDAVHTAQGYKDAERCNKLVIETKKGAA